MDRLWSLHRKDEFETALQGVTQPVLKVLKKQAPGLLKIGTSGALYKEKTRQAEGFLRLLWGLGPYYAERESDADFELIMAGIKAGVNPQHPSYWGEVTDYDQLLVEMAPLAVFLTLNQSKLLGLSNQEKADLVNWLEQINTHEPAPNNWLFFRVLVNVALEKCFSIKHRAQIDEDLLKIESFYLGNGWYCDGKPYRMDYYVSFAIHYYSLIYAVLFAAEDPARSALFKKRGATFAESFQHWFDKDGRGLPFGRSLTYRFAQSSFWSAMIFAEVKAYPLEMSKYHLTKNLEHWLKQDIFSEEGFLKIGYYYENLNMAEEYNAPGSPYWALKAFLALGLAKAHPIWQTPVAEPQKLRSQLVIPEAKMLIARNQQNTDVQAFVTDQYCEQHAHGDAKYGKFVYSTTFGFSVPKGLMTLERGAFDNGLAVSEQDDYYRTRTQVSQTKLTEQFVYSEWHPWENVRIGTVIIPLYPWHVRIHYIENQRNLRLSDGGFAVPFDGPASVLTSQTPNQLSLATQIGKSGVRRYDERQQLKVTTPQANVNLLYPCVVIPYLLTDLPIGQTLLCSSFLGGRDVTDVSKAPVISQESDGVRISYAAQDYYWDGQKKELS